MGTHHTVVAGDCIASIAFRYGHYPDTIWEHEGNAALRELRDSGYVLMPGDVVYVPDLREKRTSHATDQRHRFRRRGVPEKLDLRIADDDVPRANLGYVLDVDGREREGSTDADGRLSEWIPPAAKQATLRFEDGEVLEIDVGALQPVTEPKGAHVRLHNLGFLRPGDEEDPAELFKAICNFQHAHDLPASGEMDDDTRAQLVAAHGC